MCPYVNITVQTALCFPKIGSILVAIDVKLTSDNSKISRYLALSNNR